jgi:hypothetical protein
MYSITVHHGAYDPEVVACADARDAQTRAGQALQQPDVTSVDVCKDRVIWHTHAKAGAR